MKTQKMSGDSHNPQAELLAKLQKEMPEIFSEGKIDFSKFKATLGEDVVADGERYGLSWAGKSNCFRQIQEATTNTLKPCRDESVNFDETENLFIEGDNLQVMKVLQKSYYGKVKMIYIDPPYNTGNDFIYNDKFSQAKKEYLQEIGAIDELGNVVNAELYRQNTRDSGHFHSTWMNMMYPRLFLARNLLMQDGVIFVSIDENEVANLRKMMDEIFGEENFAGEIVWKNSSKNDQAYISIQHEYILCYVRNKNENNGDWREEKEGLPEIYKAFDGFKKKYGNDWIKIHEEALKWFKQFPESNPISSSKHYSWMDERGIYFPADISGPNFGQYRYDVLHPITGKVCKAPASGWRYPEETMKQRIKDNLVHFGADETTIPNNKTYLEDTEFQSLTSVKYKDGRVASKLVKKLLEGNYFPNPKDVDILKILIKAVTKSEYDVVLDFFAGSGTTAHAVAQLNAEDEGSRKWICVQLPEKCNPKSEAAKAGYATIADIGKERIRRANKKIAEGNKGKKLDLGFKAFKLEESNFKVWNTQIENVDQLEQQMLDFIDNVREGATSEDLLYELILKSGRELNVPIEEKKADGQSYFRIGDGTLVICLADKLTKPLFEAIAKDKPEKIITLDRAFEKNDQLKTNILLQAENAGVKEFKVI